MRLESLPGRPLGRGEFEAVREAESVSDAHEFVSHGGPEGDAILQFVVEVDQEYIALHFDPFAERWETVARSESFDDVSEALSDARGD